MKDGADIESTMNAIGIAARAASAILAQAPAEAKTRALLAAADKVIEETDAIVAANAKDMEFGLEKGLSDAMMDRLALNPERIAAMAEGLRAVAGQDDPVGAVMAEWDRPTGLHIQRVRTPIGVNSSRSHTSTTARARFPSSS